MDKALYVAMTGARASLQAQTTVSHNLANSDTPGFKEALANTEAFPIQGQGYASRIDALHVDAGFNRRIGAQQITGNALDLAFVQGRGEFLPRLGDPLSLINGAVTPPATYLSAEEILRRQYIAHLADSLARDPDAIHPRTTGTALAQPTGGKATFLDQLVEASRQPGAVDRFLARHEVPIVEDGRCTFLWRGEADEVALLAGFRHGEILLITDHAGGAATDLFGRLEHQFYRAL